jgi:hypothetical protein
MAQLLVRVRRHPVSCNLRRPSGGRGAWVKSKPWRQARSQRHNVTADSNPLAVGPDVPEFVKAWTISPRRRGRSSGSESSRINE